MYSTEMNKYSERGKEIGTGKGKGKIKEKDKESGLKRWKRNVERREALSRQKN